MIGRHKGTSGWETKRRIAPRIQAIGPHCNSICAIALAVCLWFVGAVWSASDLHASDYPDDPILCLETGRHTSGIRRIDIASDGTIVSASHDKSARIWRVINNQLVADGVLRVPMDAGFEGTLSAVGISADAGKIAVGGITGLARGGKWTGENFIYLFGRQTGEMIRRIGPLPQVITHLRFRPDGEALVACLEEGGIRVYNPNTGKLLWLDGVYIGASRGACWANAGVLFATGDDGALRRYDEKGRMTHKVLCTRGARPGAIAVNGQEEVAVGYADVSAVSIYREGDLGDRHTLNANGGDGGSLGSVSWSNGQWWAGGTYAGQQGFRLVNWSALGCREYTVASNTIYDIMSLPSRQGIAVATGEPSLAIIDGTGSVANKCDGVLSDLRGQSDIFAVSSDASIVRFGLRVFGGSPMCLDLKRGILLDATGTKEGLSLARTVSRLFTVSEWKNSPAPTVGGAPVDGAPGDINRSMGFSPDDQTAVLGSDGLVRAIDPQGGIRWAKRSPAAVWSIVVSGDGRSVVAACGDGVIRWYRLRDGEHYLSVAMYSTDMRWIAWTPSGYFWTTTGADGLIGWHVNRGADQAPGFFPVSRFADKFNRPDVVRRCLEAAQSDTELAQELGLTQTIAQAMQGVPRVRITAPDKAVTLPAGTELVTVEAAIENTGGGIDEVRVLVNGKALDGTSRGLKAKAVTSTYRWDIPLAPGSTEVTVTAFSTRRTESLPETVTITVPERKAVANLYGITIAVNAYQNPRYCLDGPVRDAEALVKAIDTGSKPLFGSIRWTHLRDAQVSRAAIHEAFAGVQKQAKPEDTLLVFYAGHGVMEESETGKIPKFYLVTPDILQMYGHDDVLAEKAVSADHLRDWCRAVAAQKQVLLIDACQAGGAVEAIAMRGAAEERALAMLSRSAGATVIAAAGAQESASEVKALGHGVFTYALIEGLTGKARTGDRPVTVRSLDSWVSQLVPELTKKHRTQMQVPTSSHRGQDFPLTLPNNN